MSKRFRRQDAAFYKRLGTKWRRPKGHQSKMRAQKGGAGRLPRIGYGSKERIIVPVVRNEADLNGLKSALIASSVGAQRVLEIAKKAGEQGIKILNMKKVKRAKKIASLMQQKKEARKAAGKKEEAKTEKAAEKSEAKQDAEKTAVGTKA